MSRVASTRDGHRPSDRAVDRPARARPRRRAARPRGVRGRARADVRRRCPATCTRSCATALAPAGHRARSTPTRPRRCEAAWAGTTIVTTGTASGKSLCFNLPTLEMLLRRPARARALPLPDQGARAGPGARAARASGCTSSCARRSTTATRRARSAPRSAGASNLDPHQPRHAPRRDPAQPRARGATSSRTSRSSSSTRRTSTAACSARHVAQRAAPPAARRRRLRHRAALPARVSATIANPVELAERLTGLDDVAARRRRRLARRAARRSRCGTRRVERRGAADAPRVAGRGRRAASRGLVREGSRTICFMKSRKGVELIAQLAADELARDGHPELAERVAPYRAGYTPQQRRELEQRLTSGELLAVVTTDALELGIDIGALDAAVCVTFPGTVASLRQMWGRAGRRGRGLAVYVAGEDALDQFFCRHPDEFLERPGRGGDPRPRERADPPRRTCSAPRTRGRSTRTPTPRSSARAWRAHAEALVGAGELRRAPRALRAARARGLPGRARLAALGLAATASRSSTSRAGEVLGHRRGGARVLDRPRGRGLPAPRPLVRGRASSTSTTRRALVAPFAGDWYTQPKRETDTEIERLLDRRETLRRDAELRRASPSPSRCSPTSASGSRDHEVIDLQRARPAARPSSPRRRSGTSSPTDRCSTTFPLERAARRAARDRARADRGAAAAGDVRPLGHRRPLDERRTRRPAARRSSSTTATPAASGSRARASALRASSSRDAHRADRRVPVRERLPVVRAVAEVRQPQRAAAQGRRRSRCLHRCWRRNPAVHLHKPVHVRATLSASVRSDDGVPDEFLPQRPHRLYRRDPPPPHAPRSRRPRGGSGRRGGGSGLGLQTSGGRRRIRFGVASPRRARAGAAAHPTPCPARHRAAARGAHRAPRRVDRARGRGRPRRRRRTPRHLPARRDRPHRPPGAAAQPAGRPPSRAARRPRA